MQYHAHIYYQSGEIEKARSLYQRAIETTHRTTSPPPFTVWRFFTAKVGPHPLPMFEIQFNDRTRKSAIEWLNQNRGTLSVLIHEDTGNDHRDHTTNVQWLGNPLPIDFKFFETIKTQPELTVHAGHSH